MRNKYIFQILQMFIFAALLFAILYLFSGCATNRALVSDIGNGSAEYRRLQDDIRAGETELALTGAGIEAGITEIERSIGASAGTEQKLDAVIRRIRARELDPALVERLRNSGVKTD